MITLTVVIFNLDFDILKKYGYGYGYRVRFETSFKRGRGRLRITGEISKFWSGYAYGVFSIWGARTKHGFKINCIYVACMGTGIWVNFKFASSGTDPKPYPHSGL